jgi:hypothetical protein
MNVPKIRATPRYLPFGFAAIIALTGCDKEGRKTQGEGKPEARERSVKRERTEATTGSRQGPLTPEERLQFEATLEGLEGNRGRFLDVHFGDTPLGPLLARLSLADLLEIFGKHQYLPGSGDERVILMHYFTARTHEELDVRIQFLLDRNDPNLTNLCLSGIAPVNPEKALEVVNATIPKGSLRAIALMNLFNRAATADFDRAARLANSLENPYERGVSVTEILSNTDVTMVPLDTVSPLILNNPQTFTRDTVFAVQAISHHTVANTLQKFDLNVPWQRKIVLGYLIDRGRSAKKDVRSYVESPEGQLAFGEEERKTIMATFGANIGSSHGTGHD